MSTHVFPSLVAGGDALKVELKKINQARLPEGDYEGQVQNGNQQTVAYITLHATN